jgi:hypothetical protein
MKKKRSTRRRSKRINRRRRSTIRRSTRRRSTIRRSTRRRSKRINRRRRSKRRRSTRRRSKRINRRVKAGDSPLDVNEKEDTKHSNQDKKTRSVVDKSSTISGKIDKLTLMYIYHEVGKYPNHIPETIRVEKSSDYNLTKDTNTFNITGKSLSLSLVKPRIYGESDNVYTLSSGMTRINFKIDDKDKTKSLFNYPEKEEELPYFKSS